MKTIIKRKWEEEEEEEEEEKEKDNIDNIFRAKQHIAQQREL